MTAPSDRVERDQLIIEEIVTNLRPWSRTEQEVYRGVRIALEKLRNNVFEAEANARALAECKPAARKIQPHFSKLMQILRRLPADHQLFIELRLSFQELMPQLEQAGDIIGNLGRFKLPTKKTDLAKNFCAFFACGLITSFSRRTPTGTAEHPLRRISTLLYKGITGKQNVDMKRACDLMLKVLKKVDQINKSKLVAGK
jgi:hypothetical protein